MSTEPTRPDIPAAAAEAALRRVAELAETWDVAAEVDARCGRLLLDVIHGSGSADVRLSRVIAVAESWLAPGSPGLFYPAAGQALLDAIRGASTEEAAGWRDRAEAAEAKLAEVRSVLLEGGQGDATARCRAIAITGTGEPLSAACTGPDCGEQFADSETGEYLFATRERMERLLYADGWAAGPVLCPACQQEPTPAGLEAAGQMRLPEVPP